MFPLPLKATMMEVEFYSLFGRHLQSHRSWWSQHFPSITLLELLEWLTLNIWINKSSFGLLLLDWFVGLLWIEGLFEVEIASWLEASSHFLIELGLIPWFPDFPHFLLFIEMLLPVSFSLFILFLLGLSNKLPKRCPGNDCLFRQFICLFVVLILIMSLDPYKLMLFFP